MKIMPKLFHNIRKDLIKGSRLRKYLIYAVGEIVLLVAGILIAVQINNMNSRRIERNNESKSYENNSVLNVLNKHQFDSRMVYFKLFY